MGATDADGIGGFFNLPTGAAVALARRAEDDVVVGASSFTTRASKITYVVLGPDAR